MNINKPFSLLDLLESDFNILSWSQKEPGTYSIYWEDQDKEYQYYVITTAGLRFWHEHLPEVVECLNNKNGDVDGKLLQTTYKSHWRYQNHDVSPGNEDKTSVLAPWKLDSVLKVRRDESKEDSIIARVKMYKVATTPSGVEYVSEQVTTNLIWHTSWLDLHFKNGAQLFQACEAMGLSMEETGSALQKQYLPRGALDVMSLAPPDDISVESES